MKSTVTTTAAESVKAGLFGIAIPAFSGRMPTTLKSLDERWGGVISRAVKAGDCTGERDQVVTLYPTTGPTRVTLVGMGEKDQITPNAIRRASAIIAQKALEAGAAEVACFVPKEARRKCSDEALGRVIVEGAGQGGWFFDDLRSKPKAKGAIKSWTIVASDADRVDVERGRKIGSAIAMGQVFARNLQMLPGNRCPPSHIASVARALGQKHGFQVTILRRPQLVREGLNALLAVAQGSAEEPRLVVLQYRGAGRAAPVCLVGKGVTFDAGGISIKPALNMEEMKFDMSGAAAVLGTFEALGHLKPRINVVGVVPTTENLPSGTAIKPGDVVKTHLGKTVEIINTDAEGRLILCDALSYARRYRPACMIDAATLTGAIVIGLGHVVTGAMGNNADLMKEIIAAGDRAGERCWELPLWEEYASQLKSDTADIKNVGGRPAGSITAGWFLREFVADDMPWVHLDIAGTAYTDSAEPGMAKGPTGVGVRLFSEFVLGRAG
jgi:leucyl aminopeptidase